MSEDFAHIYKPKLTQDKLYLEFDQHFGFFMEA